MGCWNTWGRLKHKQGGFYIFFLPIFQKYDENGVTSGDLYPHRFDRHRVVNGVGADWSVEEGRPWCGCSGFVWK